MAELKGHYANWNRSDIKILSSVFYCYNKLPDTSYLWRKENYSAHSSGDWKCKQHSTGSVPRPVPWLHHFMVCVCVWKQGWHQTRWGGGCPPQGSPRATPQSRARPQCPTELSVGSASEKPHSFSQPCSPGYQVYNHNRLLSAQWDLTLPRLSQP